MKRLFAGLLCLVLCLTLFAACGDKTPDKSEAVLAVEALIDALDAADDGAIREALVAYDKLGDDEKALVGNYDALKTAKERADEIAAIGKEIADVTEEIRQQKLSGSQQYSENLEKAKALIERYNALSDGEKARTGAEEAVAELEKQLPAIEETQGSAEEAAAEYLKAFRQLHPDETVQALYCIGKRDSEGTFYYIFALTAKAGDAEKNYYATARSIGATAETYVSNADAFFAAAPVSTHDAVKNGNITLDLAKVESLIK